MSSPNEPRPSPAPRRTTLRAALLASHLALAAVLVLGFGIALFASAVRATYRQAEADLLGAARLLAEDLAASRDPSSLAVAELYQHRFGRAPRDQAYFAVWDATGRLVAGSRPLPDDVAPEPRPPRASGPHPFHSRRVWTRLEVLVATADGGQLLIGRPLSKEYDALARLVGQLLAIGAACAVVGGLGAWWLAERIARPIARMTDAAESVTGRDSERRLDAGDGPQELVRLATAFNATLDRLRDAIAQQVRFTADASHELRTPTAVILSQTEHSLARDRSPEDYRAALDVCRRAAVGMKRLVDDLLLLARADSGRLALRTEPLDLSEVARSTVALLRPLAEKNSIRLEFDGAPAIVSGDADRLRQVIANLVANAIHYNTAGGSARVSTAVRDGRGVLLVEDSGVGISPEHQSRLFERFYRVDDARTQSESGGVGLGLSVAAELVAAHGGEIELRSTPGVGTTVEVRLPLATPPHQASAT